MSSSKYFSATLLMCLGLPFLASSQQQTEPLTNERVITLTQSGVRSSEIVRVICAAPSVNFLLIPSYTDQILRAGVSTEIFKLMAVRQLGMACPTEGIRNASVRIRNASYRDSGPRDALLVPRGQPVRLRLTENVSSAHTKMDDIVQFEVLEDVVFEHSLLIERGASAWGTVTDAHPKKRMGRAGTVEVQIDFAMLANGDKIALKHTEEADRHGHTGLMVGLMVPTAVVDWPVAPLWLLMHGKESVIKDGRDFVAFTDSAVDLDRVDFEQR